MLPANMSGGAWSGGGGAWSSGPVGGGAAHGGTDAWQPSSGNYTSEVYAFDSGGGMGGGGGGGHNAWGGTASGAEMVRSSGRSAGDAYVYDDTIDEDVGFDDDDDDDDDAYGDDYDHGETLHAYGDDRGSAGGATAVAEAPLTQMHRTNRRFFVYNRRRKNVSQIVRERYLREDGTCPYGKFCDTLQPVYHGEDGRIMARRRFGATSRRYIPDTAVFENYIELFELRAPLPADAAAARAAYVEGTDFSPACFSNGNVIILNEVLHQLGRKRKTRFAARVRALADIVDANNRVFNDFYNRSTYVVREDGELESEYDVRCMLSTHVWLSEHLLGVCSVNASVSNMVVTDDSVLTAAIDAHNAACSHGGGVEIEYMSTASYFGNIFDGNDDAHQLYLSLREVAAAKAHPSLPVSGDEGGEYSIGAATHAAADGKFRYREHASDMVLESGLKSGRFVQGTMRVNAFNPLEATVAVGEAVLGDTGAAGDDDVAIAEILVPGMELRNRAVHMDVVIVALLPRSEWMRPSNAVVFDGASDKRVSVRVNEGGEPTPTGIVVGIKSRTRHTYVCTVTESGGLAVPLNRCIPKMRVHTGRQQLHGMRIVVHIDEWPAGSRYPSAHYVRNLGAIGEVETEISAILCENDVNVQPFSVSMMRGLPVSEEAWHIGDSPDAHTRLDLRQRARCTTLSVDPLGSVDVDDVLSIEPVLRDGGVLHGYRVGVHIADVSHFVRQGTPLDVEAARRSTTVYLADRRIDMLPAILSETLCSLHSHCDRFAFSVFWEVDLSGAIVHRERTGELMPADGGVHYMAADMDSPHFPSPYFCRTIIHNEYEVYYERAQRVIDGTCAADERALFGADYERVRAGLTSLLSIARGLKQRRLESGALELASTEMKVKFKEGAGDDDVAGDRAAAADEGSTAAAAARQRRQQPSELVMKEDLDVHWMIAELMILANSTVARRISRYFPKASLLRRHGALNTNSGAFVSLVKCAAALNIKLDVSSNKALAASLNNRQLAAVPDADRLLRIMTTKTMAEAEYFSTGSADGGDSYHYGLALEYYTHFTSPIRRYADVVVHRLLSLTLEQDAAVLYRGGVLGGAVVGDPLALGNPLYAGTQLADVCAHINVCHRNAKNASRESTAFYQTVYFSSLQRSADDHAPLRCAAMVWKVHKNSIQVFVPRYGLEGVAFLDAEGTDGAAGIAAMHADVDAQTLRVEYADGRAADTVALFAPVQVSIEVRESPYHLPSLRYTLLGFGRSGELDALRSGGSKVNVVKTALSDEMGRARKRKRFAQLKETLGEEFYRFKTRRSTFAELRDEVRAASNGGGDDVDALALGEMSLRARHTDGAAAVGAVRLWTLEQYTPLFFSKYDAYRGDEGIFGYDTAVTVDPTAGDIGSAQQAYANRDRYAAQQRAAEREVQQRHFKRFK